MFVAKKIPLYALFIFVLFFNTALAFAASSHASNIPRAADTIPLASLYVGNSDTKKFHYSDCPLTQKIAVYYRVFFDSREEALKEGYVPCEVCKP